MICIYLGCGNTSHAKGLCRIHYGRFIRNGDPEITKIRKKGTGTINASGYIVIGEGRERKFEHVRVAEKALGKHLPKDAVVHHIDGDSLNNSCANLVICQDRAYHKILHRRERALDATGDANKRLCPFCKKYDDEANMHIRVSGQAVHKACVSKYNKSYAERRT